MHSVKVSRHGGDLLTKEVNLLSLIRKALRHETRERLELGFRALYLGRGGGRGGKHRGAGQEPHPMVA